MLNHQVRVFHGAFTGHTGVVLRKAFITGETFYLVLLDNPAIRHTPKGIIEIHVIHCPAWSISVVEA